MDEINIIGDDSGVSEGLGMVWNATWSLVDYEGKRRIMGAVGPEGQLHALLSKLWQLWIDEDPATTRPEADQPSLF